ncbi:MAG: stage V sporulation protein AC [Oscillibacter sp.]|nr:stage V sporulation protein AC [Oscillibacter sp.]
MEISKQEYQKYVQDRAKSSPIVKNCALAFVIGGGICVLGQAVMDGWMAMGLEKTDAGTATSICLVFLSVLLTGMNLYNKLGRYGGAGTLVPITGFANAVASPAIDFKSEGLVTGMAAKMFTVAGPVIVFGVTASVIYGVILMLL